MMLLIDSGNSRIKLGWLDRASGAREAEAVALEHRRVADLRDWVRALPHAPLTAIGANVAGASAANRIQTTLGMPVTWLRAAPNAGGVRNGYTTPKQLGADRWMALVGLATRVCHPDTPLLLANIGTATTIDTLSPLGEDGMRDFIGGVILPGVNLMHTALAQRTAQLPLVQGHMRAFPTQTDQAIASGVCAAQAGAIVLQWRRTVEHFGRSAALYLSGGGGDQVTHALKEVMTQACIDMGLAPEPVRMLAAPVLDGLAYMAQQGLDGLAA